MNLCQHGQKITLFCLSESCRATGCSGCTECMKQNHHHNGPTLFLNQQDIARLPKKYAFLSNKLKEKRKDTLDNLYRFLLSLRSQVNLALDQFTTDFMDRLKYPYLHAKKLLPAYRKIQTKEFGKMTPKQLRCFYEESMSLNGGFQQSQQDYYNNYLLQMHGSIDQIKKNMEKLEIIFQFKFSDQVVKFRNQFINFLSNYMKIGRKQGKNIEDFCRKSMDRQNEAHAEKNEVLQNFSVQWNLTPVKSINQFKPNLLQSPNSIVLSNQDKINRRSDLHHSNDKNLKSSKTGYKSTQGLQNLVKTVKNPSRSTFQHGIKKDSSVSKTTERENALIKLSSTKDKMKEEEKVNPSSSIKISEISKVQEKKENSTNIQPQKIKKKQGHNHRDEFLNFIRQREENIKKRLDDMMKKTSQLSFQQNYQKILTKEQPQVEIFKDNHKKTNESLLISKIEDKQQVQNQQLARNNLLIPPSKKKYRKKQKLDDSLDQHVPQREKFTSQVKLISGTIKKEIPLQDSLNDHDSIKHSGKQSSKQEKHNLQSCQQLELEKAAIFWDNLMILLKKDKKADLITYLQKQLQKNEDNLTAAEYLSFCYLETSRIKESQSISSKYLQRLSKCHAQNKHYLNLLINKSSALNLLGRYSESITLMEEQISQFQSEKLHKNMGDAYFSIGAQDKAVYHYQKATKLNCIYEESFYNLSVCLYMQESYFNAKMNILKALQLNKNNQEYQILLIHIQQKITNSNV